jgi:hypothetical protein
VDGSVVLVTFLAEFDAAMGRLAKSELAVHVSEDVIGIRSQLNVLLDACRQIRAKAVAAASGTDNSGKDDSGADCIRTLFQSMLSVKPSLATSLLDAMLRMHNGQGLSPSSGRRRSASTVGGFTSPLADHGHVQASPDALCVAYGHAAHAIMAHNALTSVAGLEPQRVVALYVNAVNAAAAVYEQSLVEALVAASRDLAMTLASETKSVASATSDAKTPLLPAHLQSMFDTLTTTCDAAMQRVKGIEKLLPQYYAVHFVGPAFSEVCLLSSVFPPLVSSLKLHVCVSASD